MVKAVKITLVTLLVWIIALGSFEGYARSSFGSDQLTTPSWGVNIPLFNIKAHQLEQLDPTPECIFVGSSLVYFNIFPTEFERGYFDQTGKKIECYNFGLEQVQVESVAIIARWLVEHYHPKLLIFGTLSRDYFEIPTETADQEFLSNDWVEYRKGNFSTEGWLIEHSSAYRYVTRYRSWASPEFTTSLADWQKIIQRDTPDGFHEVRRSNFDVTNPPRDHLIYKSMTNRHLRPIPQKNLDGLDNLLALNTGTTHVLMIETPMHMNYINYFPNGAEDYTAYVEVLRTHAARHGVSFWTMPTTTPLDDSFWGDTHHLLGKGARRYSYWLGIQVGEAINQDFFKANTPSNQFPLSELTIQHAWNNSK